MEIQLSKKQSDIIQVAGKEQAALRHQLEQLQKHINEILTVILDEKGMEIPDNVNFRDGKLIIPDKE